MNTQDKKAIFKKGMRDGVPIGLGYLAVSFSLGIAAKNAGLNAVQSALTSLLCTASAGEYAGFTLIAANASYIEVVIMMLVINARYMLMSCAMSQRMAPDTKLRHRLIMSFDITDELFAIAISRQGRLEPFYSYGAALTAAPPWVIGTALGTIAGNVMPLRLVSAFSVALYGMFLAVIIPPSRKDKVIGVLVLICFILSYAAENLSMLSAVSSGTKTIVLTIAISAIAAVLFPRGEVEEQ